VHGGAGSLAAADDADVEALRAGIRDALAAGAAVLASGGSATDAVVAAVVSLEDCPLFNAGTGAVLNSEGEVELTPRWWRARRDAPAPSPACGVSRIRSRPRAP
jgi:beta-aspartyl-peptidase (threonine type)